MRAVLFFVSVALGLCLLVVFFGAACRGAEAVPGALPGATLRIDLPEQERVVTTTGAFMWMAGTMNAVLMDAGYGDVPVMKWDSKVIIMDQEAAEGERVVPLWDRLAAAKDRGAVACVVVSNRPGPLVGGLMIFGTAPILTIRVSVASGVLLRTYNFRTVHIDVDPYARQPPTKVTVKRG